MGRQIQLFLADSDEELLERHLRSLGDLRILKRYGSSSGDLEVASLADAPEADQLYLWFTNFRWTPGYTQTSTTDASIYVANHGVAPILEYDRIGRTSSPGRLHWGDRFLGEPAYDRIAFGRLVDRLWRWVRKTGQRYPPDVTWSLPEAARTMNPIYRALERFRAATGAAGVYLGGISGFPGALVGSLSQRGHAQSEFTLLPAGKVTVWLAHDGSSTVNEAWPDLAECLTGLLPVACGAKPRDRAP